jgi:cytochrome c biogenesis protein CcdA
MAALFALGVMSIAWMIVIAAMIAIEKLLRWKEAASRSIAVLLLALGFGVAFAPWQVPGLTLPGSHAAMRAMSVMQHRTSMHSGSMPRPGSMSMPGR